MNAETRNKLLESIAAAQGQGSCRYVIDEKPGCVVAQFASRCGVPLETLKQWDAEDEDGMNILCLVERSGLVPAGVAEHTTLLLGMQREWDSPTNTDESARASMTELVGFAAVSP